MAYTRVGRIDHFDAGNGGPNRGNPTYWPEDILFLINEENPRNIVERNIIFKGKEITGMMSEKTTTKDVNNLVIVKCPPYFKPLEEIF